MSWCFWPDLSKEVLNTHCFKSHFSPPFDRYNNRLTAHAYTITKGSTVYFYWGHIHRPVWHPRVLGWSVNGSNLPGQADSHRESPQDWLVRLAVDIATFCDMWSWKQLEVMPFGHRIFWIRKSCHFVAPHHPPTHHHYRLLVVSTTLRKKLSKMADKKDISTSYPLKSPTTE